MCRNWKGVRQVPYIELLHPLKPKKHILRGEVMYLEVGSEVGGAGSEFCVSLHLYGEGRGSHLPAFLDLPL